MTDLELCTKIETELEALIDKHSLRSITTALAIVCYQKAAHIEENWQDRSLSRQWQNAAKAFDKAWSKIGNNL